MKELQLPISEEILRTLQAGEPVLLSGKIYTARDAAHRRIDALLRQGKPAPIDWGIQAVYYAGPCPAPQGRVIGSCGPTTSSRMDKFAPDFIGRGLKVMIGKGPRSPEVVEAIQEHNGVYLAAAGGAGALYADRITACRTVAFEDLGAEAIRELMAEKMPLTVAIDSQGGNIYEQGARDYGVTLRALDVSSLDAVMELYRVCVADMRGKGYKQWDDVYPNAQIVGQDMASGHFYGAYLGEELAGVMAADDNPSPEYAAIPWGIGNHIFCVHRLAVRPMYQRTGVASLLVNHAEKLARQGGYLAMHLDTCSDNDAALSFYQRRGYRAMGNCIFPRRTELTFVCLEKIL